MTNPVLQQDGIGVAEMPSAIPFSCKQENVGWQPGIKRAASNSGFSLIEILIVLLVFSALTAFAASLVLESNKSLQNRVQSSGLSAMGLVALNQITREVRMAGYPTPKCFSQSAVSNHPGIVAIPFVTVSSFDLVFEADIDGDGRVERIEYVLPPGSTELMRNLTVKNPDGSIVVSGTTSSTILVNIQNQAQGQPLFTWDIDPSNSNPFPQNIRTVYVNAILQSSGGGTPANVIMTATCPRMNP